METDFVKIFQRIKALMKPYEGDELIARMDLDSKYDLWSEKDVVIADRPRKEVYFAGLIIQSKHVGFYYMSVYMDTELKDVFQPELLKLLKGKSCFHVKKLDDKLEKQIADALKIGYDLYKKRGWV